MAEPVKVSVRSELDKILSELGKVRDKGKEVAQTFRDVGKGMGESITNQAKATEGRIGDMRNVVRRAADQMKQDFKSLLGLNAVQQSLALSNQFKGSISEAINLNDTMRKLGTTLGIVSSQQSSFLGSMMKNLGQVGLSSESAAKSLEGLAETPVRGEKNLIAYSKAAGQLASISGEFGNEGAISKGLSQAVVARGQNPNDLKAMGGVTEDVLRIRQATGKSASDILGTLNELFSHANKEFQGALKNGGAVTLGTAAMYGGKESTAFLEKYMSGDIFSRMGQNAMGMKGMIGPNGEINQSVMDKVTKQASRMGMGDVQAGLKVMGMGDEEAQGFMRLSQAMKDNGRAIEEARTKQVDINKAYQDGMGLGEAFRANIERVKSMIASPMSAVTGGMTDLLKGTSKTASGAALMTLGGGALAAVLAGGGLRALGGGFMGSMAKSQAFAAITGKQAQHVWVDNASEISSSSTDAFKAIDLLGVTKGPAAMGMLGKAGMFGTAALGGIAVGNMLSEAMKGTKVEKDYIAPIADAILRAVGLLKTPDRMMSNVTDLRNQPPIHIKMDDPRLKASTRSSRGGAN